MSAPDPGFEPIDGSFDKSLSRQLLSSAAAAAREAGAVLLQWRGRVRPREKGPADLVTEADEAAQRAIEQRLTSEFPDFYFIGEEGGPAGRGRSAGAAGVGGVQQDQQEVTWGWIVDPLDGTTNYVHGMDDFCVSIGLRRGPQLVLGVIYDPVRDQLFHAVRGGGAFLDGKKLAVSHAKSLDQALVAASFAARVTADSIEVKRFVRVLTRAQAVRRMGSAALNLAYVAAGRLDAYWASSVKLWDVAAGLVCVHEAGGQISGVTGAPFDLDHPHLTVAATQSLHRELLGELRGGETESSSATTAAELR